MYKISNHSHQHLNESFDKECVEDVDVIFDMIVIDANMMSEEFK